MNIKIITFLIIILATIPFLAVASHGYDKRVPDSIVNLGNDSYAENYINWTWDDPLLDNNTNYNFIEIVVYLDGKYVTNVPIGVQYYNATGLENNTQHTLSTQTIDDRGFKTNHTWVNDTEWTKPSEIISPIIIIPPNDTIAPSSISHLINNSYAYNYINWIWNDPTDSDFAQVTIYVDGKYVKNISKGVQYYNLTGLIQNTSYTISTRTIDTSGNINETWVNDTESTSPIIDGSNGSNGNYILLLDGYTGYITVNDSDDLSFTNPAKGWTISILFRPDTLNFPTTFSSGEGNYIGIMGKIFPVDKGREYEILMFNNDSSRPNRISNYLYQTNCNGNPYCQYGAGSYFQHYPGSDGIGPGEMGYDPNPIRIGEWIDVTATFDDTNSYIYKNGIFMRCDRYNLSAQPNGCISPYMNFTPVPGNGIAPLRIGGTYTTQDIMSVGILSKYNILFSESGLLLGAIKDARIYDRRLNDTEIYNLNADMYNGINSVAPSNLIFWHNYRLGNANDQSGHGHDGTLIGGSQFSKEIINTINN